jgi:hypothetical protein
MFSSDRWDEVSEAMGDPDPDKLSPRHIDIEARIVTSTHNPNYVSGQRHVFLLVPYPARSACRGLIGRVS